MNHKDIDELLTEYRDSCSLYTHTNKHNHLVWSELTPDEHSFMARSNWSYKYCMLAKIHQAHLPHLLANNTLFDNNSWKSVMADGMEGNQCSIVRSTLQTVSLRRAQLRESSFGMSTLCHVALDRSGLNGTWCNYTTIDTHTFLDGAQGLETVHWADRPRILFSDAIGQKQYKPIAAIGQTPLRHPTIHDAYLVGMRLHDGSTHIQCRSFVGSEEAFVKHIDTEVPKNYQKTHRLSLEFLHKELDTFKEGL
jgi:hypothetical protein